MPLPRGVPQGIQSEAALVVNMLRRIAALERAANSGSAAPAPVPGIVPIGGFISGPWTTTSPYVYTAADGGVWIQVRNQTVPNGAVDYPELAGYYPGWVSGNDLVMPDTIGRVLYHLQDGTPGSEYGSNSITLTEAQMPSHTHSGPSHTHTGPSHTHSTNPGATTSSGNGGHGHRGRWLGNLNNSGGNDYLRRWSNSGTIDNTPVEAVGDHTHSTNPGATTSSASGTGATGASGTGATGSAGSGASVDVRQAGIESRLFVRAA